MSNRKTIIAVDRALLPALVGALRLASATALCCSNPKLREAFDALNDQVKALVNPLILRLFDEEKWTEFLLRLTPESTWSIRVERRHSWHNEADIVIETENYRLSTDFRSRVDARTDDIDGIVAALIEEIEVVAPIGCKRIEPLKAEAPAEIFRF